MTRAVPSADLPRAGAVKDGIHYYPVRIYYEDTDAAGLVYFANYLKFTERARTEWLRLMGYSQQAMRDGDGIFFVVRQCSADFRAPARLDDDLVVATSLTGAGAATLDLLQNVLKGEGVLVKLSFQIACVGADGRPRRIPPTLRDALPPILPTGGADAGRHQQSEVIARHAR